MSNKIQSYLRLMRPQQWIKNVFVFLPLFFSFRIIEFPRLIPTIWAFIGFCLVSSSIYIINDWNDIEEDKLHPKKSKRPLASGAVNKREGLLLSVSLVIVGIAIYAFAIKDIPALLLLLFYFILNILYSVRLKHISIIDISIVAMGFVIRVFVGGLVSDISVSRWLAIMTFLVAMFFVLGKRLDDVLILEKTGNQTRKNLKGYNLTFLNAAITIVTTIIIIAYIMYTFSAEVIAQNGQNLYLTSVFVIIGLFRYLQIIFVDAKSGNPTKIVVRDKFIIITAALWLASFVVISLFFK